MLHLAEHLDVPLRERNALLLAAGYAPAYGETPLDAEAMAPVRAALDKMLAGHAPYPAVIVDRRWDLVSANAPALAILDRRRRAGAARAAGQHDARLPAPGRPGAADRQPGRVRRAPDRPARAPGRAIAPDAEAAALLEELRGYRAGRTTRRSSRPSC